MRGGLSRRDADATRRHVEDCESCQALVIELTDVNRMLVRSVVPLFIVAGTGKIAALAAGGAAGAAAAGGSSRKSWWLRARELAPTAGGVAAATALVAGLVAAGLALVRSDGGPTNVAADAAGLGSHEEASDGGGGRSGARDGGTARGGGRGSSDSGGTPSSAAPSSVPPVRPRDLGGSPTPPPPSHSDQPRIPPPTRHKPPPEAGLELLPSTWVRQRNAQHDLPFGLLTVGARQLGPRTLAGASIEVTLAGGAGFVPGLSGVHMFPEGCTTPPTGGQPTTVTCQLDDLAPGTSQQRALVALVPPGHRNGNGSDAAPQATVALLLGGHVIDTQIVHLDLPDAPRPDGDH